MIIHTLTKSAHAWRCLQDFLEQGEVDLVMRAWIARRVHQLYREIDALGWRVGLVRGQDIFLAQDWGVALDLQATAAIVIGHDAFAENDAFARLEFDHQRHGRLSNPL